MYRLNDILFPKYYNENYDLMNEGNNSFENNYQKIKLDIVKMLLCFGINTNYISPENETALSIALYVPVPELFELLLKFGADPNFKDEEDNCILDKAYKELFFYEMCNNKIGKQNMEKIINFLSKSGAK